MLPALDFEESFTPGGLETRPLEDIRGDPAEMPEGIPGDAAALVRMINAEEFVGPVNIGNPMEFTVLELAKKVLALTGSKSRIALKPLPSDDPVRRCPDISLAKCKLGWEPRVGLDEGLGKTIEYFREKLAV